MFLAHPCAVSAIDQVRAIRAKSLKAEYMNAALPWQAAYFPRLWSPIVISCQPVASGIKQLFSLVTPSIYINVLSFRRSQQNF